MPDEYEEMLDKTLAAYEESTTEDKISDVQFGEIEAIVRDYVDGAE